MSYLASLPHWPILAAALALLVPWGIALMVWEDDWTGHPGWEGLLALLIALLGMAATGFALYFGGIGILIDHPQLSQLVWEWTPLRQGQLAWWGVAGWMGFGMQHDQTPMTAWLFLSAVPPITTSVLLTYLPLRERVSPLAGVIVALLVGGMLAPLVGNWTQAGGWLMHVGEGLGAGQGFWDAQGMSFLILPAGVALAAIFIPHQPRDASTRPWAALGTGLMLAGMLGWILLSPLQAGMGHEPVEDALHGFLAAAAGGLTGLLYGWILFRVPDALWTARGTVAGLIAGLALLPWLTPGQTLIAAALAAWLAMLLRYLLSDLLHREDAGDVIAIFGLPALVGLLAVGLFMPAPGQMRAQLLGVLSILLLGFIPTMVLSLVIMVGTRIRPSRQETPIEEPEHGSP